MCWMVSCFAALLASPQTTFADSTHPLVPSDETRAGSDGKQRGAGASSSSAPAADPPPLLPFSGSLVGLPLPAGTGVIDSIDGRSVRDAWILADGTVYHFDGKRVRTSVTPLCASLRHSENYAMGEQLEAAEMERVSAPLRRQSAKAREAFSFVEYTHIAAVDGHARVFGHAERYWVRGGGFEVFSARVFGKRARCDREGNYNVGQLLGIVVEGKEQLSLAVGSGGWRVNGVASAGAYQVDPHSTRLSGLSGRSLSDAWVWSRASNAAWHFDGLQWQLRPVEGWSSVCSVRPFGDGGALALGSSANRKADVELTAADSLARWEVDRWRSITLPAGASSSCVGLQAPRWDRWWLFDDSGRWFHHDGEGWSGFDAPAASITTSWCDDSGACLVAGAVRDADSSEKDQALQPTLWLVRPEP